MTTHPSAIDDYKVETDAPRATGKRRGDDFKKNGTADFELIDAGDWQGVPPPERKWLVRGRLPAGSVTMLSGDGAAGKTTIALQLAVATVRGTDWLGRMIETPGPVIFFTGEEDSSEIHRRLAAIVVHNNASFGDLKGKLHLHCRPCQDALLGIADRSGVVRATPLMGHLEAAITDVRPALVVIEAAADVFSGSENDRSLVRQSIGLLRRPAMASGAAILLLAHPSLTGLSSGSGTSGTTGWNNTVRSRLYFTSARDGTENSGVRELKVMKSNYGPAGEVVRLRWHCGVFVPDNGQPSPAAAAAARTADDTFLKLLDKANLAGRYVSDKPGKNYAPTRFENDPENGNVGREAFGKAMERLFTSRSIKLEQRGSPSRRTNIIVRF